MSARVHAEAQAAPKSSVSPTRTGLLAGSRGEQLVSQPPLVQAKLTINQPNDRYEQEADRVADAVMRMAEPLVQRQPEEEEEEEVILRTKEAPGQTPKVTPNLEARIQSLKGGGQPLPKSTRTFFEPRFSQDFSQVRIHSNPKATQMTGVLNAKAFTMRHDIVFGTGQYSPETTAGKKLLAHELMHVVQQKGNGRRRMSEGIEPAIIGNGGSPSVIQRRIMIGSGTARHQMEVDERRRLLAPGPSHRDAQIISRHPALASRIVDDMVRTNNYLEFSDLYQLQSELIKRLTTSVVMTATQHGGAQRLAFGYPHRRSCINYGPRVNYAARNYWEPKVPDGVDNEGYTIRTPATARHPGDPPDSGYVFTLRPSRRNDGYQALMNLFVPQPGVRRRNRTLIHCDHLASLIHYRSFAAALGVQEFNRRVSTLRNPQNPAGGYIIPLELRWNGFMDLGAGGSPPESRHLQRVPPTNRDDLVIGDHVVFFNHILYDFLLDIVGHRGNWRMENAILVDRESRSGSPLQDIFQGHGSNRNTEGGMKLEMRRRFNEVVHEALGALRADFPGQQGRFPGVFHIQGNSYYIRGTAVSGSTEAAPVVCDAIRPPITLPAQTNWHIHQIGTSELDEIPGLYNPRVLSIVGGRIVYQDQARQLWPVRRPVESA